MRYFLLASMVLFSMSLIAQQMEFNGAVNGVGIITANKTNPFWFYTNTSTQLGENTNLAGLVSAFGKYSLKKGFIEAGVSLMARDGVENTFQRRDLYFKFENNWLKVTLGSKQRDVVADGVSATNKNYLWSNNARPLPGLILEASQPFKLNKIFAVDWGIAHYQLNDNRFVKDTRIHYKRLGLVTKLNEKHKITARLTHFAQWAGTHPDFGKLKGDVSDFWNVFIANRSTELGLEGEIQNAVGNHLGTYFLEYELGTDLGKFSFYHEHPFEDGSGTRFANFPDGVWGLQFNPNGGAIFSTIIYEYIDTRDQSANTTAGADGYFRNGIYRSGWTYEENIIGMPFYILDRSVKVTSLTTQFISARAKVHHIGLAGNLSEKISWKLKSTFVKHLGTYKIPFEPSKKSWHNYVTASYKFKKYGTLQLLVGVDFQNIGSSTAGGGASYLYQF